MHGSRCTSGVKRSFFPRNIPGNGPQREVLRKYLMEKHGDGEEIPLWQYSKLFHENMTSYTRGCHTPKNLNPIECLKSRGFLLPSSEFIVGIVRSRSLLRYLKARWTTSNSLQSTLPGEDILIQYARQRIHFHPRQIR